MKFSAERNMPRSISKLSGKGFPPQWPGKTTEHAYVSSNLLVCNFAARERDLQPLLVQEVLGILLLFVRAQQSVETAQDGETKKGNFFRRKTQTA